MPSIRFVLVATCALAAAPALAQQVGGWGTERGWDTGRDWSRSAGSDDSARIGKVEVSRFRTAGEAAAALGKGTLTVVAAPDVPVSAPGAAAYEAAVVDVLAHAGYDTAVTAGSGQVAEVRVTRDVLVPQEAPHKPVSGEMAMGVSNYGSMMGLGINIDLSKPRKALITTRLEARIRDRVSGQVLWEGRADIVTREGDQRWTDRQIAARLAGALFDGFPLRADETLAAR